MDAYRRAWEQIVKPTRYTYSEEHEFTFPDELEGIEIIREDFEVLASGGKKIRASLLRGLGVPCPTIAVYLHTFSGNKLEGRFMFEHFLPYVGVLLYDALGCGNAEGEYVTLGLKEGEDLRAVLKAARQKVDFETVLLWGRSMGAATALHFVAGEEIGSANHNFSHEKHRHGERTHLNGHEKPKTGVAATSTPGVHEKSKSFRSPSGFSIVAAALDSPFPDAYEMVRGVLSRRGPGRLLGGLMLAPVKQSLRSNLGVDVLGGNAPARLAPRLRLPAVFLLGEKDDLVDLAEFKKMVEVYAAEKKDFRILEGLGHADERREEDLKPVVEFLFDRLKEFEVRVFGEPRTRRPQPLNGSTAQPLEAEVSNRTVNDSEELKIEDVTDQQPPMSTHILTTPPISAPKDSTHIISTPSTSAPPVRHQPPPVYVKTPVPAPLVFRPHTNTPVPASTPSNVNPPTMNPPSAVSPAPSTKSSSVNLSVTPQVPPANIPYPNPTPVSPNPAPSPLTAVIRPVNSSKRNSVFPPPIDIPVLITAATVPNLKTTAPPTIPPPVPAKTTPQPLNPSAASPKSTPPPANPSTPQHLTPRTTQPLIPPPKYIAQLNTPQPINPSTPQRLSKKSLNQSGITAEEMYLYLLSEKKLSSANVKSKPTSHQPLIKPTALATPRPLSPELKQGSKISSATQGSTAKPPSAGVSVMAPAVPMINQGPQVFQVAPMGQPGQFIQLVQVPNPGLPSPQLCSQASVNFAQAQPPLPSLYLPPSPSALPQAFLPLNPSALPQQFLPPPFAYPQTPLNARNF